MNSQALYLAWLRTYAPSVYTSAVRKAIGRPRSLGGLGDDLLQTALAPKFAHSFLGDDTLDEITVTGTMTPDPITVDNLNIDTSLPGFDSSSISAPNFVPIDSGTATGLPAATSTGSSGSTFSNILQAVTAIGAGVINANNQSKLVTLNTQRASQGLPPVNAQGQIISPYATGATSPGLLAFENAITGGGGSAMPMIVIAALGIGAILFFKSRGSKSA